jgi:vancomycin resistance protein YoaR
MSRRRVLLFVPAGLVVLAVVGVLGAWVVAGRTGEGEVADQVVLAGSDVGGMSRDDVTQLVRAKAAGVAASSVVVHTPQGDVSIPAADIGLQVDVEKTVDAALDEGRGGLAPVAWLSRLLDPADVALTTTVDQARLAQVVAERDPTGRIAPTEPKVTADDDGTLVAAEGTDGHGLLADDLAPTIESAASEGGERIEVDAKAERLPPQFDRGDAEALLNRAMALTGQDVEIDAGGTKGKVPAKSLRQWLRSDVRDGAMHLALDPAAVSTGLGELLPEAGQRAVEPSITLEGGQPVIRGGRSGTKCCAPEAASMLFDALGQARTAPVALPLAERAPRLTEAQLRSFRIVERVGTFTTRHPAGQPRVANIHRIADIVRGAVIEPGARFSINDYVGRRTAEKGFVPGGVIADGVFSEDVGGGVSQFATTMFNAAFFAGLDFVEYQSHSIYISRYPYGREATLSYPKPDLILRNSTPYGVLIWTDYTATSITVTLWSTQFATGEQTAQTESPTGACTRVKTERTRHYVNGENKVDYVYATYRPAEGVAC